MFLKVRFLAKPKRINSLWSFGLTKSFIDIYHSVHSAGVLQNARKNAPFQSTLIYAIFSPKNPAHPSLIHVSICFKVVYVCMVEEPNQSQPSISVLGCFFLSIIPVRPRTLRRIFFATPKLFFPKSVIFFTICAEKVCYKVCNMYYKVCNMRYKVSNMCYKLCNKNFLI